MRQFITNHLHWIYARFALWTFRELNFKIILLSSVTFRSFVRNYFLSIEVSMQDHIENLSTIANPIIYNVWNKLITIHQYIVVFHCIFYVLIMHSIENNIDDWFNFIFFLILYISNTLAKQNNQNLPRIHLNVLIFVPDSVQ